MNHTIKTLPVKNLDDCEYLCYLDDNCVSLNIKDKESGTHSCELNNSTHLEHDEDLVNDPVFYYRGAKVMRTSKNIIMLFALICQINKLLSRVMTKEFSKPYLERAFSGGRERLLKLLPFNLRSVKAITVKSGRLIACPKITFFEVPDIELWRHKV